MSMTGAADRWSSHPNDRYAPRLERSDHVIDALGINLHHSVSDSKLASAAGAARWRRRGPDGRRKVKWLPLPAVRASRNDGQHAAEHHNNGVGFFGRRQQVFDG